jgi:uncharacterized cupredoxin-like copper-binding protein
MTLRASRGTGAAAALTGALLAAAALPACTAAEARGTTEVTLHVHYSHFSASVLDVRRGVPVHITVVNDDPIGHELIVGDLGVQERHEKGTERHHGARPTERDVPAGATVETTIVFDTPGTTYFACHLPGHYAYGMRGLIHVVG